MYNKLKSIIPGLLFIFFAFIQFFQLIPILDDRIHDHIMASARPAADNIIIVGIDERSINEIGAWPWPRIFIAEAIERLTEMEAAVIGVNASFESPSAFPEYDLALISAAEGTNRLVLGGIGILSEHREPGGLLELDYIPLPFGDLADAAPIIGFMNGGRDADGVMRRALTNMRYGDITARSFSYEVYRTFRHTMGQEAFEFQLDRYGRFPIRYVGGPGSFRAVSLWGVINEEYPASMFRDAIVLIGIYAPAIEGEVFTTPLNRSISTYSVEINANIIQNMLEGIILVDAHWWLNLAVLAVVGFFMVFPFRLKPLFALVVSLVLAVLLLGGVRLAYDHFHIIIRVGDTLIYLALSYIVCLILSILSAQHEKQHIKNLFGRFVAPDVVNDIISGGVDVQLGGVVKEISALFVDIRGFTAFSEANPPEKVMDMINRYLGLTCRSIQSHRGTIDKFLGDGTMALFNAPNTVPDHALCAVKAAWAMKRDAVVIQEEILKEYGVDLQFGVGINTGPALVGNMGSDFRMDYTAIGDTINTASRLEAYAGKGQIIISDATYQQVKDFVEVQEVGVINVKNKKVGILVYTVEGIREEAAK